jgi:hypothetical protein
MGVTINYTVAHLIALLQYLGPGMPPPYNPMLDVNADGWINVADLLAMLSNMTL